MQAGARVEGFIVYILCYAAPKQHYYDEDVLMTIKKIISLGWHNAFIILPDSVLLSRDNHVITRRDQNRLQETVSTMRGQK